MGAKRASAKRGAGSETRGPVLDVLKTLLQSGRSEEVVTLVEKLVARNSELEQRLAQILSRGHKNEGVSTAQLKLFMDVLTTEEDRESNGPEELNSANQKLRDVSAIDQRNGGDADVPPRKRQPALRRPLPAGLRRVDNPIAVPAEKRACPKCGAERACIGHDTTEVVELIPAEVVVRVDRREKLACTSCDGQLARAPVGDKIVSAGRLGTRLVSTVVVDKYDDGLPLNRTRQRLERMGLPLPISTLADQVTWATELLRPLWRLAVLEVLSAKVMHLDGTGLPVLDRDAPGGKRLGALWGYVGDKKVAAYLFASTGKKRGQKPGELGPEDMLENRNGYTVADASTLFDQSFKREGIVECGCHMHGRRYFAKALDAGDARAALSLPRFRGRLRYDGGHPWDEESEGHLHESTRPRSCAWCAPAARASRSWPGSWSLGSQGSGPG